MKPGSPKSAGGRRWVWIFPRPDVPGRRAPQSFRAMRGTTIPGSRSQRRADASGDRVEQLVLPERLVQVIQGARLEGPRAQLLVSICGNQDDWHVVIAGEDAAVQLEPAHARHPDIEDQTGRVGELT